MKIALFNCHARSIPPKKSGGIEKNINTLIIGFLKRGHQVTVFTTGDSKKRQGLEIIWKYPHELEAMNIDSKEKDRLNTIWTRELGEMLVERQDEFDIICNFCLTPTLPIFPQIHVPFVSRIAEELNKKAVKRLLPYKNYNYISVSNTQRDGFPDLNYTATIYNSIDIKDYPKVRKPKNFLVFVGRISEQKRPDLAIEVAKRLKMKLVIIGKYKDEHVESNYYNNVFLPALRENADYVNWIGEVDMKTVIKYFSQAKASLFPISFKEPFGNATIESLAAGCPVIAFNHGAYTETVVHGKTGFLVNSLDEMVEAVKHIDQIDRHSCRAYVEKHFNADLMVENYLHAFRNVINDKKKAVHVRFQSAFMSLFLPSYDRKATT